MVSFTLYRHTFLKNAINLKLHNSTSQTDILLLGAGMIVGYLGITAGAAYLYFLNYKKIHIQEIEQRSAALAILPILQAERDREMLKQVRKNRDEEAKLMANVEGWKVGTWYGEPIFNTVPSDTWVLPKIQEYYVHTSNKEFSVRGNFSLWS